MNPAMDHLPDDSIVDILSRLTTISLLRSLQTCKRFHNLTSRFDLSYVAELKKCAANKHKLDKGLEQSVERQDKELIKFFIRKGASDWHSALQKAAFKGNIELVNMFLEQRGDCDRGLYGAARGGYKSLVEMFIQMGGSEWNNAIRAAAQGGQKDLIEFFIEKTTDDPSKGYIEYGMQGAAYGGHQDLIEYFMGKNDGYYSPDYLWNVCLSSASRGGQVDIVELAIDKGATNFTEARGQAIETGNQEMLDYLDSKKSPSTKVVVDSMSADAAFYGQMAMLKSFIAKGATDLNWALRQAAGGGHMDIIEFLIQQGADDWNAGLEGCVRYGRVDILKFFLAKGANYWNAALQAAAQSGRRKLINFFLEKGAWDLMIDDVDPDVVDDAVLQKLEQNRIAKELREATEEKNKKPRLEC